MPDLDSAGSVLAHGASTLGSGGLGAWLMHFFRSRQEAQDRKERSELDQRIALTLNDLTGAVKRLETTLAGFTTLQIKHELMQKDLDALHERMDNYRPPRPINKRRQKRR